ncbi:Coenzyme F420 hydrogenase/dehydrogenase, beta subunit C-terminal domain [Shimia sp. CNT1-13L.2]|uniref:Coenzyme F420 hydrogenase/dehydrogenase, beta subunit C-terminal domain n=1 Tax=Shimia sp. CNT1-13L.2 TaxID=2959663 RepID=UPI0020CE979F|nr:Coenzyme F420 hydrogenase/dehydrogenase, beta subunit C-terminal domain [Shimia sp. CNT1-13L.2]MCP9484175.1 Coenzyme F420 hydrogenase/dehydrogenase, beta subunit C-terminal domain [Shimia sp. CNT1-13L.2]
MTQPTSIRQVVENGLCIGCGLCEALAPARWRMAYTPEGRLRPLALAAGDDADILAACPGAVAEALPEPAPQEDGIWGKYHGMTRAWAADPDIRFRAATGGILTALGAYLLSSGKARFVLHCASDPAAPMQSTWVMSETPQDVIHACGSRYGPSDTLAGLEAALARGEPFAVIAKPCDAGAIRQRAKSDPRIDALVVAVLVMVCGGASDLGKSRAVLDEFDVDERDLTLFRYRGYGNPGPTRIETRDGMAFEKTYLDMWADESGWRIQSRCKICPDAIGEAADLAAADIWPGGAPVGEDAGFNGVISRSARGQALLDAAVADGAVRQDKALTPRMFDDFQPHQVRKKQKLAARLRGLQKAGQPVFAHEGLRIDALDTRDIQEEQGTLDRANAGRFTETMPTEIE